MSFLLRTVTAIAAFFILGASWAVACSDTETEQCLFGVCGCSPDPGKTVGLPPPPQVPAPQDVRNALNQLPHPEGTPGLGDLAPPDVSIDDFKTCVTNLSACPELAKKKLIAETVWGIIQSYKLALYRQVGGGWHTLPKGFRDKASSYYPELNLSGIRYAEGINTGHGQAITFGNDIFIPYRLDFSKKRDVQLILHEMQHSVQYFKHGGERPFLEDYANDALDKILSSQRVNIHDDLNLEREAEDKARAIVDAVLAGQPISGTSLASHALNVPANLHRIEAHACEEGDMKVAVAYGDITGKTIIDAWWTVKSGQTVTLATDGEELLAAGNLIYAYVEDMDSVPLFGVQLFTEQADAKIPGEDDEYTFVKVHRATGASDFVISPPC